MSTEEEAKLDYTEWHTKIHRAIYKGLVLRNIDCEDKQVDKIDPDSIFYVRWAMMDHADIEPVLFVGYELSGLTIGDIGEIRKVCKMYGTIHQEERDVIMVRRPRMPWWITLRPPYTVAVKTVNGKGDAQAVVAFLEPNILFKPRIPDGMTEAL